jgi:hypothetical protein
MAVNPYIQQQADAIQAASNQNLAQNVMPGIRSGALGAGQYGSSRQGIAEGVAAGNAQTGVAGAQAQLYGNAYAQDQNNQLQQQSINNQFSLGMGNLGLGFFNAGNNYNLGMGQLGNQATAQNQNFYTQQRGQDLQQLGLGASLYGQGITGQVGVGQGQYTTGQTGYQAPLTSLQQYSNLLSPFSGLGGTQVTTGNTSGGGLNSAIGGALAGGQIGKNLGLGSGTSSSGWSMPSNTLDFSGASGFSFT